MHTKNHQIDMESPTSAKEFHSRNQMVSTQKAAVSPVTHEAFRAAFFLSELLAIILHAVISMMELFWISNLGKTPAKERNEVTAMSDFVDWRLVGNS